VSDNQSETFDRLWHEAVEEHVSGLSDTDFRAMVARVRPPTEPLDPVSQARAEAEQRQSAGRAKARQLAELTAASNERARQRINLAPTLADQAAAEAERQAAAAAEAQQPQGFLPNRGQGQSGGPPLPVNETTSQKADRLHQLSAQQKGRI